MASAPDPPRGAAVVLRRAGPEDAAEMAEVYLASLHATYGFPFAHTDDEVRGWIRDEVVPATETWVAIAGSEIVGLMVMSGSTVDQLYLRPDRWREGIGSRFVDLAKGHCPDGLALHTFQENGPARAFYEKHRFRAVWFGDGSANEEGQPDVRYEWRP
jgi:GNAT superfamily N-acetyltransferase